MKINSCIFALFICNYLFATIYLQLFIYNYLFATIYLQLFICREAVWEQFNYINNTCKYSKYFDIYKKFDITEFVFECSFHWHHK